MPVLPLAPRLVRHLAPYRGARSGELDSSPVCHVRRRVGGELASSDSSIICGRSCFKGSVVGFSSPHVSNGEPGGELVFEYFEGWNWWSFLPVKRRIR
jgi:hypothetical protein